MNELSFVSTHKIRHDIHGVFEAQHILSVFFFRKAATSNGSEGNWFILTCNEYFNVLPGLAKAASIAVVVVPMLAPKVRG